MPQLTSMVWERYGSGNPNHLSGGYKGVLTPDMAFQALLQRHRPRSNLGPGIL